MDETRLKSANPRRAAGTWNSGSPPDASRNRRTVGEMAARLQAMEEQRLALLEANRSLNEALSNAAQLQRMLSAPREIRRGRIEIAGEIFPASHLSGDFYDVQEDEGYLTLAVGDIAGKGLMAGLWFTYLVGLVRLRAESSKEPAFVAAAVNRDLGRICENPPMVALFAAQLDPTSGEMIYTNAGQPPALLVRAGGPVEYLNGGGPILGAVRDAEFESHRTTLTPGDTLVIASDGIHECRNRADEEFSFNRLEQAAVATRGLPAVPALFSILGAAQDFAGGHPQYDDLTLMTIHHR